MTGVDRTCNVYRTFVEQLSKEKYAVPILPYGNLWYCFLINSLSPQFIETRPELHPCRITVHLATHSFLLHDSYLIVNKPIRLSDDDLTTPAGRLNSSCQQKLYLAVDACELLTERVRKAMLLHLHSRVSL